MSPRLLTAVICVCMRWPHGEAPDLLAKVVDSSGLWSGAGEGIKLDLLYKYRGRDGHCPLYGWFKKWASRNKRLILYSMAVAGGNLFFLCRVSKVVFFIEANIVA